MNTALSRSTPQVEPAGLQPLVERFKVWRANRLNGQHIPEELWQPAMELARLHGLAVVVAALKVDAYVLQRRLQTGGAPRRGRAKAPLFVEVPTLPLPPGGWERGLVELVHAGGARLILHRGVAGVDELLPLVELFLRHGR
jgi:hypothetical protein